MDCNQEGENEKNNFSIEKMMKDGEDFCTENESSFAVSTVMSSVRRFRN